MAEATAADAHVPRVPSIPAVDRGTTSTDLASAASTIVASETVNEADELWEFYKPGGPNDQALVNACGYHGDDGLTHPCSLACDTLGCWCERAQTGPLSGPRPL